MHIDLLYVCLYALCNVCINVMHVGLRLCIKTAMTDILSNFWKFSTRFFIFLFTVFCQFRLFSVYNWIAQLYSDCLKVWTVLGCCLWFALTYFGLKPVFVYIVVKKYNQTQLHIGRFILAHRYWNAQIWYKAYKTKCTSCTKLIQSRDHLCPTKFKWKTAGMFPTEQEGGAHFDAMPTNMRICHYSAM